MYTIKLRRDTAARWARINPVLEDGEPGIERDADGTEKLKIGDGSTPWNILDYVGGAGDGTGPRGPQGIPGPEGPMGSEGPTGPKGLKGDKGDTGAQGPQGLVGPEGPQGPRGLVGPAGSDGQSFRYRGDWDAVTAFAMDDVVFYQGSSWIARTDNTNSEPTSASAEWDEIAIAGAQGPPGVDGIQGPEGPQGPAGPRGNPGPQGIQGIQGNTGPAGSAGPEGPQGVQGPVGDTGPMGPTGADGAPGPAGADGPEGPQGLQGPQGDPGPAGAEGVQGPQGLQGPKGDKGDPGDPGPEGIQGVAGPAGADGHSFNYRGAWDVATAYVVNDVTFHNGSSWIAVANTTGDEPTFASAQWDEIAIQGAQGAPGTDGAQGPQGIQGPAGADGAQGPQGPQGVKGDTGAIGAAGPQGPQGIQGIQGPQGPQGAPGATTVAGLTDVDLTGLSNGEVLEYDSASGKWKPVAAPSGGSGGSDSARVFDVTNVSSYDITNLDPTVDSWDVIVNGVVTMVGVINIASILPNGSRGNNATNPIRTTRLHWYTDASGAEGSAQSRMDEQGFPIAWSAFSANYGILARSRISVKTGRPRLALTESTIGRSDGGDVNTVEMQRFSTKMSEQNAPITHLVIDFVDDTFTGRIVLMPSASSGVAANTTIPYVTALPTTGPNGGPLVDGQECYYIADSVKGVVWHLKYRAAETGPYKWYCVGGDRLRVENTTANQTYTVTGWTPSPTAPQIVVPLSGDYDGEVGNAYAGPNTSTSYDCGISRSGVAPAHPWIATLVAGAGGNIRGTPNRGGRQDGLTAGAVLSHRFDGTGNGACDSPFMTIRPIRVG